MGDTKEDDGPFPVQPLCDRVIVEKVGFDSKSLIIMPDTSKSRLGARYGRVMAIGPGLFHPITGERVEPDVSVGDVVMHREYSGTPFKHGGKPYLTVCMDDVVNIIDEDRFDPFTHLSSSAKAGEGLPGLGNDSIILPPKA